MEALSKNERYTFATTLLWFLIQVLFWGFAEWSTRNGPRDNWWPFSNRVGFSAYDITEFIFYGLIPIATFGIYYFVIRSKD